MKINRKKHAASQTPKAFDTEAALNRLGGNTELYLKLLANFIQEFSNSYTEYKRLTSIPDMEDARRIIHTVKGVSGNLGAMNLHKAASELEAAIKNGNSSSLKRLSDIFKTELDNAEITASKTIKEIGDKK